MNRRILVVEDDDDARTIFADRLAFEGYEVVCATTGTEAWDLLQSGLEPAAIVLDIMLPGMDGTELRARMLRDAKLAHIPVIVVTAAGGLVRRALPYVAGFYRKPVPLDELVEAVAASCG